MTGEEWPKGFFKLPGRKKRDLKLNNHYRNNIISFFHIKCLIVNPQSQTINAFS